MLSNYPALRPSLLLDFANAAAVDPRVTFTRHSRATAFDARGQLRTFDANAPRIDYDPATLVCRGLLIEEQRTNLFRSSVYTANANGWSNGVIGGVGTIAAASFNSPAATPAGVFNVSGLDGSSYVAVTATTVSSTNAYTASVFVKNNGGVKFQLRLVFSNGGSFASFGTEYDFNTGAFQDGVAGTTAPTSRSVTNIGNGWLRITITASDNGTGNTVTNLLLYGAAATTNYNYLLFGAQLEAASFATSYIPTTTAAVTRAADVASMAGDNFSSWHNANEGTLFAESQRIASPTASGFPRIVSINDGTASNEIPILWSQAGSKLYSAATSGGVLQTDIGYFNQSPMARQKTAAAYRLNDFAFTANAQAVQTDSAGTLPTMDRLQIGSSGGFNGHICRLAYYPRRLTNAELLAITA